VILCDVNVLVYAFREDSKDHDRYHGWLLERLRGDEPVGCNGVIDSGFLRIVTHQRIYQPPSEPETAFAFLQDVRNAPVSAPSRKGPATGTSSSACASRPGLAANSSRTPTSPPSP